jgi:hypothetical protein
LQSQTGPVNVPIKLHTPHQENCRHFKIKS